MAEQFCDVGRGITLCYETFGDPADPPALLVMGLATQMIGWHEDFCEQLAEQGFYVIRFDNRDCGRSTHLDFPPPGVRQLLRRRFGIEQYNLSDMAEDAAGLIRRLEIAPAHVVGASMGGMIGQNLAAEHPELVRSLVSIMSTTGNRWQGQPAPAMFRHLLAKPPSDRDAFIDRATEVFGTVGSPGFPRDESYIRDRAAKSFDRGYDPAGGGRQLAAILASGNRSKALASISVPTLVIHGSADRLVRPSGGRATALAIPGAKLLVVKGMGHDLPRPAWPHLIGAIKLHTDRAEAARAAVPA
ncbi:MAG: alpha/beta hydrolase [Solirubrobacterales bacterium]|nr:alpha/beta hydrolase [Solirubrobacterales bacterium]